MNAITRILAIGVLASLWSASALARESSGELDRSVLPIPEPKRPLYTELDVRNATPPPHFEVKAPEGAPNVLVVLIDDLGFAGTRKFGGPFATPTFDELANAGLYFNNFHTTAVCSPTRAALKSGRNHHVANMASIIETATAFPGNTGQIPNEVAPLAEMLRLNGYSTAAFGKWHELAAGKRASPARSTAGRPARGSTSSTGSSAARPTTGHPSSMTVCIRWSCRKTRTTTF